jgi:ApaG protein
MTIISSGPIRSPLRIAGPRRLLCAAGIGSEQPTLAPGKHFEYTSGVPLSTPSGFMVGTYQMETAAGERFDIDIPAFSLDVELPSHSRDSAQSHRLIN